MHLLLDFLINLNLFLTQAARFGTSINLFCLILLKLEFLFSLFLYEVNHLVERDKGISLLSQISFWYNGINMLATLIYYHKLLIIGLLY